MPYTQPPTSLTSTPQKSSKIAHHTRPCSARSHPIPTSGLLGVAAIPTYQLPLLTNLRHDPPSASFSAIPPITRATAVLISSLTKSSRPDMSCSTSSYSLMLLVPAPLPLRIRFLDDFADDDMVLPGAPAPLPGVPGSLLAAGPTPPPGTPGSPAPHGPAPSPDATEPAPSSSQAAARVPASLTRPAPIHGAPGSTSTSHATCGPSTPGAAGAATSSSAPNNYSTKPPITAVYTRRPRPAEPSIEQRAPAPAAPAPQQASRASAPAPIPTSQRSSEAQKSNLSTLTGALMAHDGSGDGNGGQRMR